MVSQVLEDAKYPRLIGQMDGLKLVEMSPGVKVKMPADEYSELIRPGSTILDQFRSALGGVKATITKVPEGEAQKAVEELSKLVKPKAAEPEKKATAKK